MLEDEIGQEEDRIGMRLDSCEVREAPGFPFFRNSLKLSCRRDI